MQHDERIDLMRLQRMGCKFNITGSVKCIAVPKGVLGIKSWGRVDYLVNHLGYRVVTNLYTTDILPTIKDANSKKNYKEIKKAAKAHKLTDKTKKQNKKK